MRRPGEDEYAAYYGGYVSRVPETDIVAVLEAQAARAVPPTAVSDAQPPPDPLFLSTLRLRV